MSLTDYVIMPGEDYQSACDAVRAKTGKTDLIKSGDMSKEIESITTGSLMGDGEYLIRVIDYDGTILSQVKMDEGEIFTLPSEPSHERLVFEGWSSPVTITDNTITVGNSDVTIGAMYHTASGVMEVDIELTKETGLVFYFNDHLTGKTSIDWGDGTTDNTLTHTYAAYGEYTIKISGVTTKIADSSDYSGLSGTYSDDDNADYSIKRVFLPSGIWYIGTYAFSRLASLECITLPKSVTEIRGYAFNLCYALESITIPSQVSYIGTYAFTACIGLKFVVLPYYANLNYVKVFNACRAIDSITIPQTASSLANDVFNGCYGIKRVAFPPGVSSIGSGVFTTGNSYMRPQTFDFSKHTSIPTLSSYSAFGGGTINKATKILVPAALYDSWIAATQWSNLANFIVAV